MDPKVYKLLNDQINKEFYSAYLYLEIAHILRRQGPGRLCQLVRNPGQRGAGPRHALLPLPAQQQPAGGAWRASPGPRPTSPDLIGPLKAALGHEQYVTGLINAIYAAAAEARDYRTVQFLDWFIKEQGEEEKNSADQITKMELYGGDARSLYMLKQRAAGPHLHRPVPDVGVRRARRARIHNRSAGRMAPGKSDAQYL